MDSNNILTWDIISKNKYILKDTRFIDIFINRLNWDIISGLNYIPEEILKKYSHKLNWDIISKNVYMYNKNNSMVKYKTD